MARSRRLLGIKATPNYDREEGLFYTIKLYYGGIYVVDPIVDYIGGSVEYFDYCAVDHLSILTLREMVKSLKYEDRKVLFWFKYGDYYGAPKFRKITNDKDVYELQFEIPKNNELEILVQHLEDDQWGYDVHIEYFIEDELKKLESTTSKEPLHEYREPASESDGCSSKCDSFTDSLYSYGNEAIDVNIPIRVVDEFGAWFDGALERDVPENYTHYWYSVESYLKSYEPAIMPITSSELWVKTGRLPPLPPKYKVQPGRPKKGRKKDITEKEMNPRKFPKVGEKKKCSVCGMTGHNKTTCPQGKGSTSKQQKRGNGTRQEVMVSRNEQQTSTSEFQIQQQPISLGFQQQTSTPAFQIQYSSTPGIQLQHSSTPGIQLQHSSTLGIQLQHSSTPGIQLQHSSTHGVQLHHSNTHGFQDEVCVPNSQSLPIASCSGQHGNPTQQSNMPSQQVKSKRKQTKPTRVIRNKRV